MTQIGSLFNRTGAVTDFDAISPESMIAADDLISGLGNELRIRPHCFEFTMIRKKLIDTTGTRLHIVNLGVYYDLIIIYKTCKYA